MKTKVLKILCFALACMITFCSMVILSNAEANENAETNEKNYSLYYDFEDENITYGSANFVHKEWRPSAPNRTQFETYNDNETNSKALAIYKSGRPTLVFDKVIKSGNIHISFDAKFVQQEGTKNERLLFPGFFTTRDGLGDDPGVYDDNTVSKFIRIYSTEAGLAYSQTEGQDMLNGWGYEKVNIPFEPNKWYRYDFVFEEFSTPETSNLYVYINGECVNADKPMQFGNIGKVKAFFMHVGEGSDNKENPVLIDNVKVNNYGGKQRLLTSVDKTIDVPCENAELTMSVLGNADVSNITKDNIVVKRERDNKRISNITIKESSCDKVTFVINEKLSVGKYTVCFDNSVRDTILDKPSEEISFVTDYFNEGSEIIKGGLIYTSDFNDYDSENIPPKDWGLIKSVRPANIKPSIGQSGDEGDKSVMITGKNGSRRYVVKLLNDEDGYKALPCGDGVSVEFDLKYSGTAWNFSVVENNNMEYDSAVNADTYDKNIILGIRPNSDVVGYASFKTNEQQFSEFNKVNEQEPSIGAGKWHKVRIDVLPISEAATNISLSIDGGDVFSARTEMNFIADPIAGIAFTTVNSNEGVQEMCIDNLKVSALTLAVQPFITDIYTVNYLDERKEVSDAITTMTKYIDIRFSAPISTDNLESKILLTNQGVDVNYEYEALSDGKEIRIKPKEMFEPDSCYTLRLLANISHRASDDIILVYDYSKKIEIRDDAGFIIFDNGFLNMGLNKTAYFVKMSKSDNVPRMFTLAVASYKHLKQENGEIIKVLQDIDASSVVLSENDKDVYVFGDTAFIDCSGADEVKGFLWEYPNGASVLSEVK